MLEQRFVGKYSTANVLKEDKFPLLNRMRYMIRLQISLIGKEIKDKAPYVAVYNENYLEASTLGIKIFALQDRLTNK